MSHDTTVADAGHVRDAVDGATAHDGRSIDLDTIAPISGHRPPGAADSAVHMSQRRSRPSRRGVLRSALVGVTALGMSALGVFPPAREALADGYDIHKSGCNGIQYRNCKDCCCSTVCAHCCNAKGWHRRTGDYLLRPNQCYSGGGNRSKDGWFWRACGCTKPDGSKGTRVSRCHDGYLITEAGAVRTICRKRMGCA